MTRDTNIDPILFAGMPGDGDALSSPAYINIIRDVNTGRVVIALNRSAAWTLDSFLDNVDLQDLRHDGSLPQDEADAQSDVVGSLCGKLRKLMRGY